MSLKLKSQLNPSVHGSSKLDKANQEFDLWLKKNPIEFPVYLARYIWNASRGL